MYSKKHKLAFISCISTFTEAEIATINICTKIQFKNEQNEK